MLGFSAKLDKTISQYGMDAENIQRKFSAQVSHLDSNSQCLIKEFKMALDGSIKKVEADIKKVETKFADIIKTKSSNHLLQLVNIYLSFYYLLFCFIV